MDDNIVSREYGWTDSNDIDYSFDLAVEEMESNMISSDEEETPFARHGPYIRLDADDVVVQRAFWECCAIGFLLDYRKFFVRYLQTIINAAWRIRGKVTVVGRESYFYVVHFEQTKDLNHICNEGTWSVEVALFVLEKWRPNLVINKLQLNYISI